MKGKYILAIDQSTSGSKALVVNDKGEIILKESMSHKQYYPQPGWVEHDPLEIYENVRQLMNEVAQTKTIHLSQFKVLTITNQRETVVVWDRKTGEPVYRAIVWQCRRTTEICESIKEKGYEDLIKKKTGLTIDPYFSASKVKWIFENVKGVKERAQKGELLLGNIDSWLIWKLTNGNVHATDFTNASRTLLYNIHALDWDDELLSLFSIPRNMLPEVKYSDDIYGNVEIDDFSTIKLPISGIIGDSQGALFGQQCVEKGMAKGTFGTGTSIMVYTGHPVEGKSGLVTSVAWGLKGKVNYSLEGIIHSTGDIIKWIKEDLELIEDFEEAELLAKLLPNNQGVYLVPAFVGLGAPYWSPGTRAAIIGMGRDTGKAHIIRAALESISYQIKDIVDLLQSESGILLQQIKVDGGATKNKFLMKYIADILDIRVVAPEISELSSLGSAYLGGLGIGIWQSTEEISQLIQPHKIYQPSMAAHLRIKYYNEWKDSVNSVLV